MGKIIYPLKPCPWCKITPKLYMLMGTEEYLDRTWCPVIQCQNHDCKIMPKSKYVPIRKGQRFNKEILNQKIEKLVSFWNDGNPLIATEGFEIDFEDIANSSLALNPRLQYNIRS